MSIRDKRITEATIIPPAVQRVSSAFNKPVHQGPPSLVEQVGHFLWHFVQMCLACCIGGASLSLLFFGGAALIGSPDLIQRFAELSTLMIAFNVSLPMAAWMRFRGMQWRPTLEMAATPIVLAILLIGLTWLGIVPSSSLFEWLTGLACPVMLIPMLLRLDLYTGRKGHHAQVA
jgi:hypothetical protein